MARLRMARHGGAGLGRATQRKAWFSHYKFNSEGLGEAWHGGAPQGGAGLGNARQGMARLGKARLGNARQGKEY